MFTSSIPHHSWFWMHNETINIWSHLVGFLLFSAYLGEILLNRLHSESSSSSSVSSNLALVPIVIQLLSYMFCMLSSSLFHTFACHSEAAYNWYDTDFTTIWPYLRIWLLHVQVMMISEESINIGAICNLCLAMNVNMIAMMTVGGFMLCTTERKNAIKCFLKCQRKFKMVGSKLII